MTPTADQQRGGDGARWARHAAVQVAQASARAAYYARYRVAVMEGQGIGRIDTG